MNEELVKRSNRKIFGIKNAQNSSAASRIFKTNLYFSENLFVQHVLFEEKVEEEEEVNRRE